MFRVHVRGPHDREADQAWRTVSQELRAALVAFAKAIERVNRAVTAVGDEYGRADRAFGEHLAVDLPDPRAHETAAAYLERIAREGAIRIVRQAS